MVKTQRKGVVILFMNQWQISVNLVQCACTYFVEVHGRGQDFSRGVLGWGGVTLCQTEGKIVT